MSDDYYQVLGVAPSASVDECKASFRRIARANHPDLAGAQGWPLAEATRRERTLKKAAMAYSVLRDPSFRKEYDAERRATAYWHARQPRRGPAYNPKGPATQGVPARWEGFNFEDVGGGPRRAPAPRRPRKPRELKADWRSFREMAADAAEQVLCELILEMLD